MAAIWAPENRLRLWLEVELSALEAMAGQGQVPAAAAAAVRAAAERRIEAIIDPGPDRGDRGDHPPRRDRVPDPPRAGDRPRGALSASGHDLVRPARHRASPASSPRPPTCCWPISTSCSRRCAGGRSSTRTRPASAARTACTPSPPPSASSSPASTPSSRATGAGCETARAEVATCAISGAVGTFANVDPAVEAEVAARLGLAAGADLDPGDPARPPRRLLRRAGDRRQRHRAARDRDPPSAAHRGRRGGRAVRPRPEGQLGDAAQAQSVDEREPVRPGAAGARLSWSRRSRTWRSGTSATSPTPRSSG